MNAALISSTRFCALSQVAVVWRMSSKLEGNELACWRVYDTACSKRNIIFRFSCVLLFAFRNTVFFHISIRATKVSF